MELRFYWERHGVSNEQMCLGNGRAVLNEAGKGTESKETCCCVWGIQVGLSDNVMFEHRPE